MDLKKTKIDRVPRACDFCKSKRIKCTGENPCNNCKRKHINCEYSAPKKRGRKLKNIEDKYFENFFEACNYLYNGIPFHIPIMNNEDTKYNILINYNLLDNLYNYSSFEFLPFINYEIIKNRILRKEMHFSVLFGLYALSEILKPYGDYNIALKFKVIAVQFIELTKFKQKINDIQLVEACFIIATIENGNLYSYFFTKCALKIMWKHDIFNLIVSEYKTDKEKSKKYIERVYISVIIKHILAQINTGLIENIELTEPLEEIHSNMILETDDYSYTNAQETIKESIKIYERQPKFILVNKMKNDKDYFNKLKINIYTDRIDTDSLLLLKYKGNDIISISTVKSLNFYMYMNQPTKWSAVSYNCLCRLRNILYLYTNMKNKMIKFNASVLLKEDEEFANLKRDIPHELKFTCNAYRTDPPTMFLYKRRMFGFCIANRIFYYRVLLRLILKSTSSKDWISNIQTIINKNIIEENLEKKLDLMQKNKDIYTIYYKNQHNISNKFNIINDSNIDIHIAKKVKLDKDQNFIDKQNLLKYWICNTSYMEMTIDELDNFISSCIYHQIVFILKNIIGKCINFLANQYLYYARIAKLKLVKMKKTEFYEFPSALGMYQLGYILLSKYVANHGIDKKDDSLIFSFTNIEQLRNQLRNDTYKNNWYIGKQYTSDTHKIKISNIINPSIKTNFNVNTRSKTESLIILDNNNNNNNDDDKNIDNNTNNSNTNNNSSSNIDIDINNNNICDKILELIYNSEAKTKYDTNLNQDIYNFIDTYYYQNINNKVNCCKECYKQKSNNKDDKTKENFIELLKILKYFYNIDEYVPQNCVIFKSNDNIDNYLFTDSSVPSYQYFYDELNQMEKYFKEAGEYAKNLKYLINKANQAINMGLDSFENDVVFKNSFF